MKSCPKKSVFEITVADFQCWASRGTTCFGLFCPLLGLCGAPQFLAHFDPSNLNCIDRPCASPVRPLTTRSSLCPPTQPWLVYGKLKGSMVFAIDHDKLFFFTWCTWRSPSAAPEFALKSLPKSSRTFLFDKVFCFPHVEVQKLYLLFFFCASTHLKCSKALNKVFSHFHQIREKLYGMGERRFNGQVVKVG